MSQLYTFPLQGLTPAFAPDQALSKAVALPFGGPYGTSSGGGQYGQGYALGLVPGTAQSEILTLTVGTSTGTLTHYLYADKVYTVTHAYNASTATVKTAWEAVFGTGNVAVTGTAGTSYVLTLQGQLASKRLGCYLAISSNGNASWARTQRGNCGAGQYDVYDGSTVTTADAFLISAVSLNPRGGRATDLNSGTENPFAPPAWVEGFFNYADLGSNMATAAVTSKLSWYTGSASYTTGAVVRLVQ